MKFEISKNKNKNEPLAQDRAALECMILWKPCHILNTVSNSLTFNVVDLTPRINEGKTTKIKGVGLDKVIRGRGRLGMSIGWNSGVGRSSCVKELWYEVEGKEGMDKVYGVEGRRGV